MKLTHVHALGRSVARYVVLSIFCVESLSGAGHLLNLTAKQQSIG